MAHYVVSVRSPRTQAEAFDYMADLSNFAQWDPGVESATQVEGRGPGPGTAFDVAVRTAGRTTVLRYHVTVFERPNRVVARAESGTLVSLDEITVEGDGDGCVVTYDAELKLNGVLKLFDPLLSITFKKIGDKAAAGLVAALDGTRVPRGS